MVVWPSLEPLTATTMGAPGTLESLHVVCVRYMLYVQTLHVEKEHILQRTLSYHHL